MKHIQTLPVPGVPPPWTTKIKLNKGGSFRAYSRKISCLLSILIFWRRTAAENSVITDIVEWKWEFLAIVSCFAGRKGGIEEKGHSGKFILANIIRGDVHSITKKEKKLLTFHKFPLWPPLLLLPHQKFIKGISILSPMGPRGAIDRLERRAINTEFPTSGEGRAGMQLQTPGNSLWGREMGQVCQFWDHRPLTPLMTPSSFSSSSCCTLPEHQKLSKVSPSAKIDRAAPRSLSKSCSWPLKGTSGLRCSGLLTHLQTTAISV